MSAMKEYYHEYLTDTDFDLMFDDEYEMWVANQQAHREEYEQALGDGINSNYCS